MTGSDALNVISELLDETHVASSFTSGKPSLDQWLRGSAMRGQTQDTGRTWVWHEGDGTAIGYFSLAGHVIHRASLSKNQARSLPSEIPSILLAKLALDIHYHGDGLGGELLWDALSKAVGAAQIVGARYVVVDALDGDASAFYEKYGFAPLPAGPSMRLHRRLRDVASDLAGD